MKIKSIDQLKEEIIFNTELQQKLRDDPVKAIRELEVEAGSVTTQKPKLVLAIILIIFGGALILLTYYISIPKISRSEFDNLVYRVNELVIKNATALSDAASAKSAAAEAAAKAAAAEVAANRAAQYAQDTNDKLK